MKRDFRLITVSSLSALALWIGHVGTAMAANPTEVVVFQCREDTSAVVTYDTGNGPSQASSDCATELFDLLNAGLVNVNVSVQTWSSTNGPPGGLTGTYIIYVLANGTLTGGNL